MLLFHIPLLVSFEFPAYFVWSFVFYPSSILLLPYFSCLSLVTAALTSFLLIHVFVSFCVIHNKSLLFRTYSSWRTSIWTSSVLFCFWRNSLSIDQSIDFVHDSSNIFLLSTLHDLQVLKHYHWSTPSHRFLWSHAFDWKLYCLLVWISCWWSNGLLCTASIVDDALNRTWI